MMVQRFFVVVLAFALAATDSQNPSKEGYYGQLFIDEERQQGGRRTRRTAAVARALTPHRCPGP